jgi:hypothetical protein
VQLVQQIAEHRMVMDRFGLTVSTPVEMIPPPVDGVVTAVSKDKDTSLIEVSIGKDDGLIPGHKLEVYRGPKYIGRVTVRRVEANRAVAQIVPEYLLDSIRKGDRVGTQIK